MLTRRKESELEIHPNENRSARTGSARLAVLVVMIEMVDETSGTCAIVTWRSSKRANIWRQLDPSPSIVDGLQPSRTIAWSGNGMLGSGR